MSQALYHHLPPLLQSAAASLHGYRLRPWRYGPETETLVAQALERDTWPASRIQSWQQDQLARQLHHAATHVPYYRQHWQERRRRGDSASSEILANWPILEKEELRKNPRAFIAESHASAKLFEEHTSGSTGKPLTLWFDRPAIRAWYALFEARWRRWHGVSFADRWAILGGQLVVPQSRNRPPFWVWNHAFRQLYMSSYHLRPDLVPAYVEALRRQGVRYLWGYTSSLVSLAQGILASGESLKDLDLRVALTNAEPVSASQKQIMTAAFACPVRETYGLSETVVAAGECEHGALHLFPEAGVLEVVDGQFVATGLLNPAMPLIRYRTGDCGSAPKTAPCPCGRTLPILPPIDGRADDILYSTDGRPVGRLDPVFKADLPILEAQIVQESLHQVTLRLVPAPGYSPETAQDIAARIRDRMGPVSIQVEILDIIPRGPNNKFKAVIRRCPAPHSQPSHPPEPAENTPLRHP